MNILKDKTNKGFTIIELIVVIAIITVLSVIVLTNVIAYQKKARNAKRLADVRNYATVLEIAFANNGDYPAGDYCCLGRGYPDGECYGGFFECAGATNANDALKPWIPLPFDNYPVMGTDGNDYRGYLYNYNPSFFPKRIDIYWFLEGTGQSCRIGTGWDWNENTTCYYSKEL